MKKLILLELEISEELNDGDIEIENLIDDEIRVNIKEQWEKK